MFESVLIANRGEVAVRVINACHRLGIRAIAIASAPDAGALHTRLADEVVPLSGSTPAETYLNVEAVLTAVDKTGAQAVHPGYGFLSENPDFARAVADGSTAFIGPSPESIELMGSKIAARATAAAAGVPGVPGASSAIAGPDEIVAFAADHGYPIAVKAAFGGGGRGMRVIHDASDIESALESARREALAYFGNAEVYIEKYLTKPRHIEIQILSDGHGNYVWLGERDCSVQRRHQKLIEEAPSDLLDPAVRSEMGQAAVDIAHYVGYVNAGTIEFLFEDGRFWFLEMNTRLQVEHPVTEMVTGIDIVAEQIRIAAGERLSFTQSDIAHAGHAIEMRINAEDPTNGRFTPTPGTITKLSVPGGTGVRFDGGYEAGDAVSQYYDSLIGKLIVHATSRQEAIASALAALDDFVIDGVSTTIPAHRQILAHKDFQRGNHHTKWLESEIQFADPNEADQDDRAVVWINGRSLWIPFFNDDIHVKKRAVDTPPRFAVGKREKKQAEGSGIITAPLQGTVVKLRVAEGDVVAAGDLVCLLEAMKMENQITADRSGVVSDISVSEGSSIGPGTVIMTIR